MNALLMQTSRFPESAELARFYRRHLLEDVMPFWETRTKDSQCGGYLTCFDRTGNVTDTDKYIWFQGRQLWMFSALYRQVDRRPLWLELARAGRDFLVAHAYAGNGRWLYQLDRVGRIKRGTISIFTDMFVLAGLCEYAMAAADDQDHDLIRQTFDTLERNVLDPEFKDIFHGVWNPHFQRHGIYMIALPTADRAGEIVGHRRVRPLVDRCLEQILYVFAKDDCQVLFESVGRNGQVIDDDEGRVLNPGHALESMWFCIEEGKRRGDRAIIDRAVKIVDWMYRLGYDAQYGGIVSFLDVSGIEPRQMDWHKEINMMWHDKAWWVHSESLYALALAAVESGRRDFLDRFLDLHTWCQKHFFDPEYGEWYPELYRDGGPKLTDKGTPWKAAYHLPRALMKLMQLFESDRAQNVATPKL
jgi:N-acylglucosamine 2-epimerase